MNKAYKYRIYPNAAQRTMLAKTFGCCRFVYNKMLESKTKHYDETHGMLQTTPAQYKEEHTFLKEVDSLALANEQLNLERAYSNFFRDKSVGFPKFKCKHRDKNSYTTNCVNGNIKVSGNVIVLPKIGGVHMKCHRGVPSGYKLKSCTVSQTSSGRYFVSVLYEYDEQITPVTVQNVIGLDYSMRELYVSSDGEYAQYPRYYREALEQLARAQRKLSHMQKGGKNYYKQKRRIAKIHEKVANQRKDFLHNRSRQITNVCDAVAIEDLNMKAMAQALNFGKSVNDNAWGMFTSFLSYKLTQQGKVLVKIDKWFPSSKRCSVPECGYKHDELKLSDRTYICPKCGNVLDRDINAAINIRNEAMRLLGVS